MTDNWTKRLQTEFAKPYFKELHAKVKDEYENHTCHPDWDNIFNAFSLTDLPDIKVVIIGQDPYHGDNQANGLCFSVNKDIKLPPSLVNIFKEIQNEYGYDIPNHGDLTKWAKQGVFLLNTSLTVRHKTPGSHSEFGWDTFTGAVLDIINEEDRPIVYLLWGAHAKSLAGHVTNPKHVVYTSAHPSPYSASGFFGNNHFKLANGFLVSNNIDPIDWKID